MLLGDQANVVAQGHVRIIGGRASASYPCPAILHIEQVQGGTHVVLRVIAHHRLETLGGFGQNRNPAVGLGELEVGQFMQIPISNRVLCILFVLGELGNHLRRHVGVLVGGQPLHDLPHTRMGVELAAFYKTPAAAHPSCQSVHSYFPLIIFSY